MDVAILQKVKQLAQSRPADTTAATAYTASGTATITSIIVCEQAGGSAAYRIFADTDGSTYDETTALFYDTTISANNTALIEFAGGVPLNLSGSGTIGVRSSVGNALTFTVMGIEWQ